MKQSLAFHSGVTALFASFAGVSWIDHASWWITISLVALAIASFVVTGLRYLDGKIS